MQYCIYAVVSGGVQGVFYRKYTRKKATTLNITGWVKNLPNNTVELIACGTKPEVTQLMEWLWQGSPHSSVSHVEWKEIDPETHKTFEVRH